MMPVAPTSRGAGGLRRLPLFLVLAICARSAAAQEAPADETPSGGDARGAEPAAATSEAPPSCVGYDLGLDGAGERSEGEGAAFVEAWRPTLEMAAACLHAPGSERACIEVQGQYDDHTFESAVARSMGGQRAAQLHRARGRSEAVVTELAEMGVPYDRIRHRPPPAQPSYRGVRVQILAECLPPAPEATMPEWAASPEILAENLRETGLIEAPPAEAPAPEPPPAIGPFSVEGALTFGFLMSRPDDAFAFGARAAFGYGEKLVYGRVLFGVGTADHLEQRAHLGWGVSVGLRPLRWLRVGALFDQRLGTYQAFDPWFERSWHLGIEAEERVAELDRVSVWVGQSLSPVGQRYQRATVDGGQPVNSADRRDYALAAHLYVTVRGHLRAGASLPGARPRPAE